MVKRHRSGFGGVFQCAKELRSQGGSFADLTKTVCALLLPTESDQQDVRALLQAVVLTLQLV